MLITNNKKNEIVMFLAGALSVLILFLLTGAADQAQAPVGKYEMEIAHRERTYLVYVLDTTTGAVKWVEEMNTPFTELKND